MDPNVMRKQIGSGGGGGGGGNGPEGVHASRQLDTDKVLLALTVIPSAWVE